MKITATGLPGVLILTPNIYRDSRGAFSETWNLRGMVEAYAIVIANRDAEIEKLRKRMRAGL